MPGEPAEVPADYADQLLALRHGLGLSQRALAGQVGVSVVTVSRWENGLNRPAAAAWARCLAAQAAPADATELSRDSGGQVEAPPSDPLPSATAAAPVPASQPPTNLPAAISSFVGRQPQVAELIQLLGTTRLLTLTGAGGSGKTRLALVVAESVRPSYPDGVWLVELASINEPAQVSQAVADALGVREQPGTALAEALIAWLLPRRCLLVLDNCEHLIEAAATLAERLLRACPHLTVLTTSREPLALPGETTWRVPLLTLPEATAARLAQLLASEAGQLFVTRAQAANPALVVDDSKVPASVQICRRLDGLPLAIELAAARATMFSPQQLADRLHDRFRTLTGTRRAVLPRQQTLRATIEWSITLLSLAERRLFRQLAVFADSFDLPAVEAIGGDEPGQATIDGESVADLLARLVSKSLVIADERDGTMRYRLLETLNAYAGEQLAASGERHAVECRHGDYFVAFAEAQPSRGIGTVPSAAAAIAREGANLRLALERAAARRDFERQVRLVAVLWRFWFRQGQLTETRRWLEALLAEPAMAERSERLGLLLGAGVVATEQGELVVAEARLREILPAYERQSDAVALAGAYHYLAAVLGLRGDFTEQARLHHASLAIFRRLGDREGMGAEINALGMAALNMDRPREAHQHFAEALRLGLEVNSPRLIGVPRLNLGVILTEAGELAAAEQHLTRALAEFRELDWPYGISLTLLNFAHLAHRRGDYRTALALGQESLTVRWLTGSQASVAMCLISLARVANALGEPDRAVQLVGAADALNRRLGATPVGIELKIWRRIVAEVRAALPSAHFDRQWQLGERLSIAAAVELARGVGRGEAARHQPATAAASPTCFATSPRAPASLGTLTPRERTILDLLAAGLNNQAVAVRLGISHRTVERHASNIYAKLEVRGRHEAVVLAWRASPRAGAAAEPYQTPRLRALPDPSQQQA